MSPSVKSDNEYKYSRRSAITPSVKYILQILQRNAVFYLTAVLIALALKQHYSQACVDDLGWILKPTADLVSFISGDAFLFEATKGYVCDTQKVIIAPACAGVNFMLMAFGMSVFAGMHHMRRNRHRFLWLMGSLAASYGLTIVVNSFRIIISIHTLRADIYSNGLTWGWVHRLEGIVIYFFFLSLFYSMIRKIMDKYMLNEPGGNPVMRGTDSYRSAGILKTVLTGLTPCAWYLAVTLAVPFLNGAPEKTGGRFYDHAAMVLGLCLVTWVCIAAAGLFARNFRLLITGGCRKHEIQNPDC